ncbi:MAG: hypothetical protein JKX84_05800 [Flavobacteriales bacterium]|nr:hypothetical protein [Flavobacteriales bacterium]
MMVDAVLDELIKTNQPFISIKRVFEKRKIGFSDVQVSTIEHILKTKSLVEQLGQDSHGSNLYTLSETGEHFVKMFGSYSAYIESIEEDKRKAEKAKKALTDRVAPEAHVTETTDLTKDELIAIDFILNSLLSTTKPSLDLTRTLRKSNISFSNQIIETIENILKSKSLVDEIGNNVNDQIQYALSETGRDFLRTFGSYSKFLKGVEKESRKTERAKNKKPYRASGSTDGDPIAIFTPPEKDVRYIAIRLVFLLIIVVLGILVYKLT